MTPVERMCLSYREIETGWQTGGAFSRRVGYAMACDLLEALRDEKASAEVDQLRGQLLDLLEIIDNSMDGGLGNPPSRGRHALHSPSERPRHR